MELGRSLEDYLEAIYILEKEQRYVKSVDVARYMNFTKASVCYAVKILKREGLLFSNEDAYLVLTEEGKKMAIEMNERRKFFLQFLLNAGIDHQLAQEEACRMEHTISNDSFQKIRKKYGQLG